MQGIRITAKLSFLWMSDELVSDGMLVLCLRHRLLNASTDQTDTIGNVPRAEELSLGKGVSRTRVDSSRSHRGPQQSEAAVVSGASRPQRGGSLEGEMGQEEWEQDGCSQSLRGPLILTEQHNADLSPSRAGKAGRLSSGEQAGASRAKQRADTPKGSLLSHDKEDGLRAGEDIIEAGGGASIVFRKSPANQPSAAPVTQPMVWLHFTEVFDCPICQLNTFSSKQICSRPITVQLSVASSSHDGRFLRPGPMVGHLSSP